jgi:hypothetical protein
VQYGFITFFMPMGVKTSFPFSFKYLTVLNLSWTVGTLRMGIHIQLLTQTNVVFYREKRTSGEPIRGATPPLEF